MYHKYSNELAGIDLLGQLRQIVFVADQPEIRTLYVLIDKLAGNRNAAAMALRLLYWFPRAQKNGGWVYKSWRDWKAECNLSRGQVNRVHNNHYLDQIGIERKIMKASGVPTMHYRLDVDWFVKCIATAFGQESEQITEWLFEPIQPADSTKTTGSSSISGKGRVDPIGGSQATQPITSNYPTNNDSQTNSTIQQPVVVPDNVQELRQRLIALGVHSSQADSLLKQYRADQIEQVLNYSASRQTYNPPGYVMQALRQNWVVLDGGVVSRTSGSHSDPSRYITGKYADFINTKQ